MFAVVVCASSNSSSSSSYKAFFGDLIGCARPERKTKKTGRNFDLSSRLPITLMMMAVAVTFSPALPVLFLMVSVYLVITYFGDKFHLLRSCCTPPQVRSIKTIH